MALLTFVNGIADAGQAAHRIGDAAQDVGAVAKGVSSGEMSMSEGIGLYGEAVELRDNTKVFQEEYEELTQKLNEGLGDGSVGEKGMQDTIVEATNVIQDQQGVEEGNQGETYIYDGSGTAYKGFRDKETDDIGINVGEDGTNLNDGSETYSVMVHEVSHQNGADETKAHFLTDVAADSWNTENQFNGNETNTSKVNQGEWLNNQTTDSDGNRVADSLINQNTIKASQVDEFDPYDEAFISRLGWNRDFGKSPEQSVAEFNKEVIEPVANHPATKITKVLATELTIVGDITRIGFGIDPYTGDVLSLEQRKNETAQMFAFNYGGKILKTSKAIKAVIKPEVLDLQDKVGGKIDAMKDIGQGLDKSFND